MNPGGSTPGSTSPLYSAAMPALPSPSGIGPGPQQPADDNRSARDNLDRIVAIVGRSWRFRWYAALVMLLGATISLLVALLLPRTYTSETLIIYREGIGTRTVTGNDGATADAQQKLALKLKELVLSRTSLQKLIDEFHLYPAIMDRSGYVDAVNELRKNVKFAAKDGETFGLSFTGPDPVMVQKLTARLAQELLGEHSKSRLEQAGETKEFIDTEKRRSDEDLRDRESQLATFLNKHPEFAKESNGQNAGTQSGIAIRALNNKDKEKPSADPQLAALQREASRIAERLGMPTKRKPDKDIDPKLAAARADAENDLKRAQTELAEKSAQFTEEHPDVRAAKIRVKSAEGKVRRANEAIAASESESKGKPESPEEGTVDRSALEAELKRVQEEISVYKRRHSADQPTPSTTTSTANAVVELETEWTRLNREVVDARERNNQLEGRQFKAAIIENAVTSGRNAQMIIVDPAYKPTHPNKGRTQVVIAGVAASLLLSLLVALFLTLLDDRLYDRIDIESLRIVPLLGVVPRADGEKDNRG